MPKGTRPTEVEHDFPTLNFVLPGLTSQFEYFLVRKLR